MFAHVGAYHALLQTDRQRQTDDDAFHYAAAAVLILHYQGRNSVSKSGEGSGRRSGEMGSWARPGRHRIGMFSLLAEQGPHKKRPPLVRECRRAARHFLVCGLNRV